MRALAPIAFALLVSALAFVVLETWQLGWLGDGGDDPRVVPIREISEEALPLGYRGGMMNAWVHNIRVGQVVGFHEHPTRAEMVVILRGRARVRGIRRAPDGGKPLIREELLGPGEMVFSPATSVHEYANVGTEPLWTLVFMSPPVRGNVYLEDATPESELDFLVVPWEGGRAARGAFVPEWAQGAPWRGAIDYFPEIPGRLLRDSAEIRGRDGAAEAWIVLLRGSGRLEREGTTQPVDAPTWITAPGGRWSIRSDRGELVALEFSLPRVDARLFLRAAAERYGLDRIMQSIPGLQRLFASEPWGPRPRSS